MNKSLIAITALTLCALTVAAAPRRPSGPPAQIKLEDLPKRPVDTLPTADPETRIILYSNNTWSYFRPNIHRVMGQSDVYKQHWDTTQVFAYRTVQLADLPPVIELKLFDNLDGYHCPLMGKVFSKYGPRGRRNHNGVDVPLRIGEPIYATFEGKVRYAKYNSGGFGYLVILRHPNGLETWHAHLSKLNVKPDDYVKSGQIIGYGGSTGRSRGPHLHFEVRYCDQTFDPEFLFDFESGNIRYQTFALERSFFNIHSRASDQLDEDEEYDYGTLLTAADLNDTVQVDILERLELAKKEAAVKANTPPPTAVYHTIKSGDMLGKLAVRYGVSIDQICRLNNIKRTTTLQLGRKLRIK